MPRNVNMATRLFQRQLKGHISTTPRCQQRLVVAVGGNALQRRGEEMTLSNQLAAAAEVAPILKTLMKQHEVVLTHGNGPQVGQLALQRTGATWDVLGAESQGQIGYVFSQALASVGQPAAALLTQVVVAADDPAFDDPAKLVGPLYSHDEAAQLATSEPTWTLKADGDHFVRRCVPSPKPLRILQLGAVEALLEMQSSAAKQSTKAGDHHHHAAAVAPPLLPIACGGGGVPVVERAGPGGAVFVCGVEAVIDKDHCGALLATSLRADGFIILTDGGGIWEKFGKPGAREMARATCGYLRSTNAGAGFPGSMGPKVEAAVAFVANSVAAGKSGAWAAIGDLRDAEKIVAGEAGTLITMELGRGVGAEEVTWRE